MKKRESALPHDVLTMLLDYDPATGVFRWKVVTSNRVKVGDAAGQIDRYGYRQINVNGVRYAAHRLAWFYVCKVWPDHQLDHENLLKADNRIANLRAATHQQNVRNVTRRKNNKSGFKGVWVHPFYKDRVSKKYIAAITVDRVQYYLGLFDAPEEAHEAYVKASIKHHREYGRSH